MIGEPCDRPQHGEPHHHRADGTLIVEKSIRRVSGGVAATDSCFCCCLFHWLAAVCGWCVGRHPEGRVEDVEDAVEELPLPPTPPGIERAADSR